MERKYFDARFDGLEKLMREQQRNMENHISAVSANVKALSSEFSAHKESIEAHGHGASDRSYAGIIAWASLSLSALLAALEFRKGGH